MEDGRANLGRGMRLLLLCCGPMNVAGALCFSPPITAVRREFGLAEPPPFYLWVLSAWILAFGVAYFVQGWTGRADRGVLAVAAWGKGVFAGLLIGMSITGEISPFAGVAVLPDLILAFVFAGWLWASRSSEPHVAPGPSNSSDRKPS